MLRFAALLVAVAFVLPLAVAIADSCDECVCAASQDCCPASCWVCCAHGAPFRDLAPVNSALRSSGRAGEPVANRALTAAPHDVFHVPKISLT